MSQKVNVSATFCAGEAAIEIELKLLLDAADARRLAARPALKRLAEGPATQARLRSIYYDTTDLALARHGIALRLRKSGRAWVQCVKRRAAEDGGQPLSRAEEIETPAPGGRLALDRLPREAAERLRTASHGQPLSPVVETDIARRAQRLRLPCGAEVELAVDRGQIAAGERRVAHLEAELELIEGDPAAVFRAARLLFPDGGIRFSTLSKAERGLALAEGEAQGLAPRHARHVRLAPEMMAESAARAVLAECLDQIGENVAAVRADVGPEGPHQLRIGLRRLRSALALFRPQIGGAPADRLADEARWLGLEVGRLRDLDVTRTDILAPEREARPGETGFATLASALDRRAAETRARLLETLTGPRVQGFLIDLAEFVAARGWLDPHDPDQTRRLAEPLETAGPAALDKVWRKVAKRAGGIEGLDVEARHELRKALKKLRYALEFLVDLIPKKRLAPLLRELKRLQELFGDLNDAAMAEALLIGPGAPAAEDAAAQRAVGLIVGARLARAERTWENARARWERLETLWPPTR